MQYLARRVLTPLLLIHIQVSLGFQNARTENKYSRRIEPFSHLGDESDGQEYRNPVTSFLSNFMQNEDQMRSEDLLANIDFDAPKISKVSLETLAAMLDSELYEKEWFVTGNVNPSYFDNEFEFQDPDVKLKGIEGSLTKSHENSARSVST